MKKIYYLNKINVNDPRLNYNDKVILHYYNVVV